MLDPDAILRAAQFDQLSPHGAALYQKKGAPFEQFHVPSSPGRLTSERCRIGAIEGGDQRQPGLSLGPQTAAALVTKVGVDETHASLPHQIAVEGILPRPTPHDPVHQPARYRPLSCVDQGLHGKLCLVSSLLGEHDGTPSAQLCDLLMNPRTRLSQKGCRAVGNDLLGLF